MHLAFWCVCVCVCVCGEQEGTLKNFENNFGRKKLR